MATTYFYIILMTAMSGMGTVFRKNYVNNNINIKNALNIFMLLFYPMVVVVFFVMAGGIVPLNVSSFWFAFAYAWVSVASVFFGLLAYERINIVYVSVFSNAGAMVIPVIFDLFCGERFSVCTYIAVVFRMMAIMIPLIFNKSKNRGFIICILLFFVAGSAGIIPKLYGRWDGVVGDESFCFWTTVLIIPIVVSLIFIQGNPKEIISDVKQIKPSGYAYIVLSMVVHCFGTLIQFAAMRTMGMTIYAVGTSSLGMVVTVLVSKLIYKEIMTKQVVISFMLSIGAIALSAL